MKKQLFLLLLFALFSIGAAVAQSEWAFGPRLGVGFSTRAGGFPDYYSVENSYCANLVGGVFGEYKRIKLRVDAVHLVTLHKEHRLAAAQYVEVNFVGECGIGYYAVVPSLARVVVAAHPHAHVVDARRGKFYVVRVVDERAVGAHLLYHVPQRLHDAVVQEYLGRIDKYHCPTHGIQHRAYVVKHRLLAVG